MARWAALTPGEHDQQQAREAGSKCQAGVRGHALAARASVAEQDDPPAEPGRASSMATSIGAGTSAFGGGCSTGGAPLLRTAGTEADRCRRFSVKAFTATTKLDPRGLGQWRGGTSTPRPGSPVHLPRLKTPCGELLSPVAGALPFSVGQRAGRICDVEARAPLGCREAPAHE